MRRSIKYGLYAAVLASVLGSTIAWASVDKSVTVNVDGQSTQLHTVASTVKGALADAGYQVGPHDIVAPPLTSSVHGGATIVLERGRLLRLTVDGTERDVWVTAPTVQQALGDLGYESADLNAVSRSKRLPLTPTDLTLSTIKIVSLTQGTEVSQLTTTDAYVGDLLSELGITLGSEDTVTPAANAKITNGVDIVVKRVTHGTVTGQAPLPFTTTQTPDPTLNKGTTKVTTSGKAGLADVVYAVVYVDGVETGRTIVSSTTITPPTNQVAEGRHEAGAGGGADRRRSGVRRGDRPADAARPRVGRRPVPVSAATVGPRERLAGERAEQRQRRLRHPAGAARQQDGRVRRRLADQPGHPDRVGAQLHQRSLQHALRRLVVVAGQRLVLIHPAGTAASMLSG